MTSTTSVELPADSGTLPPAPWQPAPIFALLFTAARRRPAQWLTIERLTRRYGPAVTVRLPLFGRTVVVSDPALAKQVFTTSPEILHNIQPNLSRILGADSMFGLEGATHRRRRKLLTPPLHGKSIATYERIVEEETLREMASWPEGTEFGTLDPMMRITLNVILRAVFGADGVELQRLRELLPKLVTLGSMLALLPGGSGASGRLGGRWNPWTRLSGYRREYESVLDDLIAHAREDPRLAERTDVLSLFLRTTYDDGTPMTRSEIGDELLTLLAAGHETTASTLGWAFERISRHPQVLERLVAEAATDANDYRQATIAEVQRNRTVIDFSGRYVAAPSYQLGQWRLPQGVCLLVNLLAMHRDPKLYPDPERFDPQRFFDNKPGTHTWVPFGGGTRRCIGAAFANMEIDVVLRTVLRHFTIRTTSAPGEKWYFRGVAYTPKRGGRVAVHRRPEPLGP